MVFVQGGHIGVGEGSRDGDWLGAERGAAGVEGRKASEEQTGRECGWDKKPAKKSTLS